ncbi:DUF1045 domain-containing protein [Acuticoccus sp. MNP-M23]|uniref:DUF1045 domain-containing protein n=1 Tax=Acuticoccus sp. MNP-M23 TaxID=3072793 RepID=UPI00281682C8|nr:DUF1045 domain-containing protein [Acuticoccus sp. MNP-M23]WMS44482.1 DUF1045 domain-containing protein [Acuticoccus sp. MNP-M23]
MRYAIYLTPPPETPLCKAAARWLGRSPFSGTDEPAQAPTAANASVPARYGFHATMRAPFRLAQGASEAELITAFCAFAAHLGTVEVPLQAARLSRFIALVAADNAPLASLSEAALHAFEPFRAPLTAEDRARRQPERMDDRGRALLDTWGYNFVMERYVFHMTLSGPVDSAALPEVDAAAQAHFASFIGPPQPLRFALFSEAEAGGPFNVLSL